MNYQELFKVQTQFIKAEIKRLKKSAKDSLPSSERYTLSKRIERAEEELRRYDLRRVILRRLPSGGVVNVKMLDKFLKKLKGLVYTIEEEDKNLVIKYGKTITNYSGSLVLYNLERDYGTLEIPLLEDHYLVSED